MSDNTPHDCKVCGLRPCPYGKHSKRKDRVTRRTCLNPKEER